MQNHRGVEVKQLQEILNELHCESKICCWPQEEPAHCEWDYINAGNHKRIQYDNQSKIKKCKDLTWFFFSNVVLQHTGSLILRWQADCKNHVVHITLLPNQEFLKKEKGIKSLATLCELLNFILGHWQWSFLSVQSTFKWSYFSFIPLGWTLHDKNNE